ncbi:MAG TPA: sigma 54-interacting transcriptional regulator [Parvularculaceae bacterium]|nr:sigma 54-interacting transcriptional regulator [Parvularculaceae bacterium]
MAAPPRPPELIGQSPAFLDALTHASMAAGLDRPLLIVGERGSGKELLAGRIHFLSPRWEGPLVKLNCAALSEELLESELFGHEAGAFTGARARHEGRFERAEAGTLFLDEIASASLRVQEKLLRVIEYGEFERLGGEETLIADVRVVAASNVDLSARAAQGKFRADLLDRLAFDVIVAPPLRARKEDIPLLAAHFAGLFAGEIAAGGEPARFEGFTAEAMAAFSAYGWPGNVRELKNAAERSYYRWIAANQTGPVGAVVIDPFESAHRPAPTLEPSESQETTLKPADPPRDSFDLRARLDDVEREWVEAALAKNGGNQRRAAEFLNLTYDQMRGLVRKHGSSGAGRDA